jgi:thiamine transport system permease protein
MDRHRAPLSRVSLLRPALLAVPVAFLAVFFVYPVASIIGRGIAPDGSLDLSPVVDVFADAGLREVLWFTVWQAAVSTILTVVVAMPCAFVLARYDFPGRGIVRALLVVPFVLPTVVVGSAFLGLLAGDGPLAGLGLEDSTGAIVLANVFFNFAVVVRIVSGLWSHLDPHQEESARVLGAGPARTFARVTLPALRPAITAAASITFLFTFSAFGIVLLLGGPRTSTLDVEIYRQTAQLLDLPTAAALSILQLLAVMTMLVVTGRLERGHAHALGLRPAGDVARRPRTPRQWTTVVVVLGCTGMFLGAPLAVLVERSLHPDGGYGFGFYRALSELHRDSTLFVSPMEAIRNSVLFALAATVIALVVGGLAAFALAARHPRDADRTQGLDALLLVPLGTSAVTVGFGFIIALDDPPLDLRTSRWLIPIAQALIAAPFVTWVMVPVLRAIDPRLREAASVLGASPGRVWREVDVPIARRALLVAAGFAFAISLGEFGATLFIARPDSATLPVVIYRLLGQPGALNFGAAMAASVILMAVTAMAVVMIERFRVGPAGSF